MVTHTYLGNYPSDHSSGWTTGLQGVAHSRNHWFFTQERRILKFHVTTDLRSGVRQAASTIGMPAQLRRLGCNHFGDPDYIERNGTGYLFVPVEGDQGRCSTNPVLAVFRDGPTLTYIGASPLPSQTGSLGTGRAGWCAINPVTNRLYSSTNRIDRTHPVFRYDIDFRALAAGSVQLSPATSLSLYTQTGSGNARRRRFVSIGRYIQGGAFSPRGNLYIASGRASNQQRTNGLFVFDRNGRLIDRSSVSRRPFRYEFHSGPPKFEEPEGLTFWDVDALGRRLKPPGISGQLHAVLLDSVSIGNEEIFFKHYSVRWSSTS